MSVKAAFVPRSDNHVHSGLLAAQGRSYRGDYVDPGESGPFNLLSPAHGIARGGIYHLEGVFHHRIFLAHLYRGIDHGPRLFLQLGRDHNVGAEHAAIVLYQVMRALENLLQCGGHVVIPVSPAAVDELIVDPWLILFVEQTAGGQESENPRVGRGNTQVVVAEGSHAGLNDRMLYPQKVTESRL